MLAGRPPFVGEHFSGLMLDIMQRDPPPLPSLRDVPRRLAGVIHRALARDLQWRYADMPTFIMAVEAVGRDELKLAVGTSPEGLIAEIAMPRLTPDGRVPHARGSARFGVASRSALEWSRAGLGCGSTPGARRPAGRRDRTPAPGGAGCRCRRGRPRSPDRRGRLPHGRGRAGSRRCPP